MTGFKSSLKSKNGLFLLKVEIVNWFQLRCDKIKIKWYTKFRLESILRLKPGLQTSLCPSLPVWTGLLNPGLYHAHQHHRYRDKNLKILFYTFDKDEQKSLERAWRTYMKYNSWSQWYMKYSTSTGPSGAWSIVHAPGPSDTWSIVHLLVPVVHEVQYTHLVPVVHEV